MLTAQAKTIERTGTGRQFPPSLASLSATKFSLQIYMELTGFSLHHPAIVCLQKKIHIAKRIHSIEPVILQFYLNNALLTEIRT